MGSAMGQKSFEFHELLRIPIFEKLKELHNSPNIRV